MKEMSGKALPQVRVLRVWLGHLYWLVCSHFSAASAYQVAAKTADALWAPACLQHTGNLNLADSGALGGFTYRQSLASWYFGDAVVPRVLADACTGVNCGPTCPPLGS